MLAVQSLTLNQFRSHQRAELAFDGRPVAIWGANGSGKTNLLEAVSLLSPGRGLRRASAEDMARKTAGAGWRIRAEITSLGELHEIETRAQPGASRTVSLNEKTVPQVRLGQVARVVWLVPAMDRLWTESADGRRRFLDRIVMSFIPGHADAVLEFEKAMRERNRLLKDMVRDPGWYAALETRLARAGAAMTRNRLTAIARIEQAQRGATTAFPAADLALDAGEGGIHTDEDTLAEALSAGRASDMRAGRTLIGPHRNDLLARYAAKDLPARDCSTGEQKALLLSLVLSNARALAEDFGAPPLLLLDEVSAHLDDARRAALYTEIVTSGAQAWMTGTSRDFFAELGAEAQGLHVTEHAGLSTVEQVQI